MEIVHAVSIAATAVVTSHIYKVYVQPKNNGTNAYSISTAHASYTKDTQRTMDKAELSFQLAW